MSYIYLFSLLLNCSGVTKVRIKFQFSRGSEKEGGTHFSDFCVELLFFQRAFVERQAVAHGAYCTEQQRIVNFHAHPKHSGRLAMQNFSSHQSELDLSSVQTCALIIMCF